MSSDTKPNMPVIREAAPRRVWQPPQAKVIEVAAVTRNTVVNSKFDGMSACSS